MGHEPRAAWADGHATHQAGAMLCRTWNIEKFRPCAEGLSLGGSAGINIAGAMRLAEILGPGHTIVTILADYGTRYQSKLFNPVFLNEKGLPVPDWLT